MKKILIIPVLIFLIAGCEPAEQVSEATVGEDTKESHTKVAESSPNPADIESGAVATPVSADLEREKRMAAEIEGAILDGEPIYLKDGEHEFLAIDTEPESDAKGAVIILHGRGFHPDWQDTIFPLRTGLVEHGWRTLSLQMPVLKKDAKYYDYVPLFPASHARIDAAIEYLKQQGAEKIVLFAHSCGAHMAMSWVEDKGDSAIDAYVGAGMGATDYKQPMLGTFPLDKMKVPVLDIYGTDDYLAVLAMATGRHEQISEAGNPLSKQLVVWDANHYYTDKGDSVVKVVAEWLDTLSAKP